MAHLQVRVLSHSQKVRQLYKESLRNIQSLYHHRHLIRYESVLLRARFDQNKDENDMIKAKKLLQEGQRELFLNKHPQQCKFPNSPGGIGYGREPLYPDFLLDLWHPLERAQYPEYFAKREQRKKEYIDRWEKKYGKVEPDHH